MGSVTTSCWYLRVVYFKARPVMAQPGGSAHRTGDSARRDARNCAVNRDALAGPHFGHTQRSQRSILVNHNKCYFAAQCGFGWETSIPKRVRFPAASPDEAGQDHKS